MGPDSSDELDDLPVDVAYDRALNRAMRLLARRSRSRWEIRDRLTRAGFDPEVVEKVEARLAELAILDDSSFALEWVEQAAAGRGLALGAIRKDLALKGVEPDLVEAAIRIYSNQEGESESDRALRLARRRLGAYRGLPRPVANRRLAGFLAQRGYEEEVIWEVCGRILGEPRLPESGID